MHAFYENRVQIEQGNLPVSIYTNRNFSFLAHWHQETEIAWVKSGRIRIGINHDVYTLMEGGICLIRSGDIHYYESFDEEVCIVIMVCRGDMVEEFAAWVKSYALVDPVLQKDMLRRVGLDACCEQLALMQVQQAEKQKAYISYMKAIGSQILIEIMRKWPVQALCNENVTEQNNGGLHHVKEILVFIEQNITQPLSLEYLAKQFHLDSFYLSKLFNKATGMHFKEYLNEKRISLAKEKLVGETYEEAYIGDIAWECGFLSVRNFNRVFKSITGMTPREYKITIVTKEDGE